MPAERIGLFGGTFDPPHVAHLAVAEAARQGAKLDRVIWMPAHASPFKGGVPSSAPAHRLEMTRRAVASNAAFSVSSVEIERGGVSYTVDTLRNLRDQFPDAEFYLIIGGDSLAGFPEWRRAEEIVEMARLLVYARPDQALSSSIDERLRERVEMIDGPPIGLSATALRRHISNGRSARYLVPDSVLAYIVEHRLYQPIRPITAPDLQAS